MIAYRTRPVPVPHSPPMASSLARIVIDALHSLCFLVFSTFKKRAPRAIKEVSKFARQMMGTKDVRIDVLLNKFLWSKGVRNVPYRVRVRLHRRRNEDEEATEKLYTHVTHVSVPSFDGLQTKEVAADE